MWLDSNNAHSWVESASGLLLPTPKTHSDQHNVSFNSESTFSTIGLNETLPSSEHLSDCSAGRPVIAVVDLQLGRLKLIKSYCNARICITCGDYKNQEDVRKLRRGLDDGCEYWFMVGSTSESERKAITKQVKHKEAKLVTTSYQDQSRSFLSDMNLTPRTKKMCKVSKGQALNSLIVQHLARRTKRLDYNWIINTSPKADFVGSDRSFARWEGVLSEVGVWPGEYIDSTEELKWEISRAQRRRNGMQ